MSESFSEAEFSEEVENIGLNDQLQDLVDEELGSDEEASEEANEEELAELERQAALAQARSKSRASVSAERTVLSSDWQPPAYEKTPEQYAQIQKACSKSFMFSALPPDAFEVVIAAFQGPMVLNPGTEVIRQGAEVTADEPGLYIILSGQLGVYKSKDGSYPGDKVFMYDTMGQSFGELALLYNVPRAATIIAESESVVWSINRDTFNYCVKGAQQTMRQQQVELLASAEVLRNLTADDRNKIADVLFLRNFKAGEYIIRKGERGTEFFLLQKGAASAQVNGKVVQEYRPGAYFGELALINAAPRAADVVADETTTTVGVLDGESFKRLLGSVDELKERAKKYANVVDPMQPGTTADAAEEDDEEDNDDDVLDDEEFERQMQQQKGRGAREAVAAERWEAKEDWVPPVHSKTPAQYDFIQAACSKSFMFSSLSSENMKMVIDAFKGPQKVKKGVEVIREGATVSSEEPSLFILEKGVLNVFKAKQGKKHPGAQVFTFDKTGQAFGEIALLYNCPRTATVIANKESLLWSIDRDTFNYCVKGAQAAMRQKFSSFLQSVELLQGLTMDDREKIADVLQVRNYEQGDQIIQRGEDGIEFFMLMEGSAFASVGGQRVQEYSAGQYFGELALLKREPRAADVFADASPTVVAVLASDEFSRLLGNLNDLMEQRAQGYARISQVLGSQAPSGPSQSEVKCRSCGNTGLDLAGEPCSCKAGQMLRERQEAEKTSQKRVSLNSDPIVPLLDSMSEGKNMNELATVESDASEDEEVVDEAENERIRKIVQSRQGHREGVIAEHWEGGTDFQVPTHYKTPNQYESIRDACTKSFIFNTLPVPSFEAVIQAFNGPVKFSRGQEVIRQGDIVSGADQGLYILERGRLNVFKSKEGMAHPGEQVYVYEKAGQSFGEVALLYNCPRTATVVAANDSVLWSIDRDTFNHCVKGARLQFRSRYGKFLASIDILRSLTPDERDRVIDVLQVRRYSRGDYIIRKGDIGNEFYMVEEGGAYAQLNGNRVKQYGPMHYFGELALMYRQPRAADVIADVTPTTLAMLDADSFRRLLGNLREIMAERAKEYGMGGMGDSLTKDSGNVAGKGVFSMVPMRGGVQEDWFCNARRCYFRNFGRAKQCFKCGQPRPPSRSAAANAFGPMSPLSTSPVSMSASPASPSGIPGANWQSRQMDRKERSRIVLHAVEVGATSSAEGSDVYVVKYPRRLPEVGFIQGMFPLVPGENFKVTVYSLGTFGEIGVGLSPLSAEAPKNASSKSVDAPPVNVKPRGSAMVGWGAQEIGCMGDHGRWYVRGQEPGAQASSPWQEGDVLECGVAESGNVYVRRNGTDIACVEGYWPAENAYPTVTFHSGGAQVLLNLADVSEKRAGVKTAQLPAADAAKEVLSSLQRTVVPSAADRKAIANGGSRWCFWCSCRDVDVKKPESLTAGSPPAYTSE